MDKSNDDSAKVGCVLRIILAIIGALTIWGMIGLIKIFLRGEAEFDIGQIIGFIFLAGIAYVSLRLAITGNVVFLIDFFMFMRKAGGKTISMKATSKGDTEKVQALLAEGADVNAKDNTGVTALQRERLLRGQPLEPNVNAEQDDWKQYPTSKLEKVKKLSDDVWLYYKNKPGKFSHVFWIGLSVLCTLVLLFCIVMDILDVLLDATLVYLFLIGLTVGVYSMTFLALRRVVIEIDRRQGTLKERRQFLHFTRREGLFLLSTFNTVELVFMRGIEVSDYFQISLTGPTSKKACLESQC